MLRLQNSFLKTNRLLFNNIRHKSSTAIAASSSTSSVDIDWDNLGFDYTPTKSIITYQYKDGKWEQGVLGGPTLEIHAMSNVLHYGQAVFEGLKAFHTKSGKVHVFNDGENASRLQLSADRLGMPPVPKEIFHEAIDAVIKDNVDYIPPYGSGGSLYIRPFYFGHGAKLGLGQAPEYCFGVLVSPVGSYYKSGLQAVDSLVIRNYDRAAPHGVGNIKCAGNYAADVKPATEAQKMGYTVGLYLDAAQHKYIEEFSTSNFIAIKDNKYITPTSDSILASITNKMLQRIAAEDLGLTVEARPVEFDEVRTFEEVAACGTAVIVTPVKSITDKGEKIEIGDGSFDTMIALYDRVRSIQSGDAEDKYGWCRNVCDKPLL